MGEMPSNAPEMAAMLGGVNGKVSGALAGTPGALPLNRGLVEKL